MSALWDLADAAPDERARHSPGHVGAVDADASGRGTDDPAHGIQERALAGAVRADQSNPLAAVDAQRDGVDRDRLAVADDELLDLEQRRHSVADPKYASTTRASSRT